jgi:hypothetical protein
VSARPLAIAGGAALALAAALAAGATRLAAAAPETGDEPRATDGAHAPPAHRGAGGAPSAPPTAFAHELLWREGRGERRTVEGNLVALTCWVKHAGFGHGHRNCARACAEAGLPVGLVDAEGRVFLVSGRGHGALAEANRPLLDHLETTVRLTGDFFDGGDLRMVEVVKVERAAAQASDEELARRREKAPPP